MVKRGLAEDKVLWLSRKYTFGWIEIFALIMHLTELSLVMQGTFSLGSEIAFCYQKSALLLARELHIS